MTLILSWISNDYAIQVSDRRLTKPSGELYDDEANKVVSWCGDLVFSYCGLGFTDSEGKERTDNWLANMLRSKQIKLLSDVPESIQTESTACFKKLKFNPQYKRHAFVGIGWVSHMGKIKLQPIVSVVSNYLDDRNRPLTNTRVEFKRTTFIIPPNKFSILLVNGVEPGKSLVAALRRKLEKCAKKQLDPLVPASLMVQFAREVAKKDNRVGSGLMVTTLPHPDRSPLKGTLAIYTAPQPNFVTYYYISSGNSELVRYAPNFVCHGVSMSEITIKMN